MTVVGALPQKTIKAAGSVSGIGLHTGAPCTVHFRPAPVGSGIRFFRAGSAVGFSADGAVQQNHSVDSLRCTSVRFKDFEIQTVEHLLAALHGFQISNLNVEVDGPEIPGLDGSAGPFVDLFKRLGLVEQELPQEVYRVPEPIFCSEKGKAIAVYPAESFSISYVLDYPHPLLRNQQVDFVITPETFEREIAPARTFCTQEEGEALKQKGFGKGANTDNTVVISREGIVKNKLRFPDECARHKTLDILGDLKLLGFPILGRVVGLRSGHALNQRLVEQIKRQREVMKHKKEKTGSLKCPVDVEGIKGILPHREPFLLVDRVMEAEESKLVAVKHVSPHEPYFKGHFPGRPVMPGVLILEALAQAGGVLMLSKNENAGKIAYLAGINDARFRRVVVPGDELRLEVEILKIKSKVGVMKGVAKVRGEEVCSAQIMFSLVS